MGSVGQRHTTEVQISLRNAFLFGLHVGNTLPRRPWFRECENPTGVVARQGSSLPRTGVTTEAREREARCKVEFDLSYFLRSSAGGCASGILWGVFRCLRYGCSRSRCQAAARHTLLLSGSQFHVKFMSPLRCCQNLSFGIRDLWLLGLSLPGGLSEETLALNKAINHG